jgi:hypothetical protein
LKFQALEDEMTILHFLAAAALLALVLLALRRRMRPYLKLVLLSITYMSLLLSCSIFRHGPKRPDPNVCYGPPEYFEEPRSDVDYGPPEVMELQSIDAQKMDDVEPTPMIVYGPPSSFDPEDSLSVPVEDKSDR